MAKLWPSRSSMVVRASRLMSDGIVKPEICTALAKSRSLTAGTRRKLMMPLASTVGKKAGGIARQCNQIRLGKPANQILCFQRADHHVNGRAFIHEICDRDTKWRAGRSRQGTDRLEYGNSTATGGRPCPGHLTHTPATRP